MPARTRADWIPSQLGVKVGVDVDETRCHDAIFGVNFALARSRDFAHSNNSVAENCYIGFFHW